MYIYKSIDEKFKLDESSIVIVIVMNVFGPGFAHHIYQNSICRVVKFYHNKRRTISFLCQKWIVIPWESILWFICNYSNIFTISSVLKGKMIDAILISLLFYSLLQISVQFYNQTQDVRQLQIRPKNAVSSLSYKSSDGHFMKT